MKRIYKYFILLLPIMIMVSCDRGDDPKYADLKVEETSIVIDLTKGETEKQIAIISDNGNYKLFYANRGNDAQLELDQSRVEVELIGKSIHFKGKKRGEVDFRLFDWANKETLISVEVKEQVELILEHEAITTNVGLAPETQVYDGNGGYKLTSLNPEIATAELIEPENQDHSQSDFFIKADIKITAISAGIAKFEVTDAIGSKATLEVKVREAINKFSYTEGYDGEVIILEINDQYVELPTKGGNGGFVKSAGGTNAEFKFDEENNKIFVKGKFRSTLLQKYTVSEVMGQSLNFQFVIDDQLEKIISTRARIHAQTINKGSFGGIERLSYDAVFQKSTIEIGSSATVFGLTISGDYATLGAKNNGEIYIKKSGKIDPESVQKLAECQVVKTDASGRVWIKFTTESGQGGYVVAKK